jgi:hypothetical protein
MGFKRFLWVGRVVSLICDLEDIDRCLKSPGRDQCFSGAVGVEEKRFREFCEGFRIAQLLVSFTDSLLATPYELGTSYCSDLLGSPMLDYTQFLQTDLLP